jgi:hypothetical protein
VDPVGGDVGQKPQVVREPAGPVVAIDTVIAAVPRDDQVEIAVTVEVAERERADVLPGDLRDLGEASTEIVQAQSDPADALVARRDQIEIAIAIEVAADGVIDSLRIAWK